jgi:hypothetical protein
VDTRRTFIADHFIIAAGSRVVRTGEQPRQPVASEMAPELGFPRSLVSRKETSRKEKFVFLLLILAQAAHSVEESVARLYDVFAPARLVSGLISRNLALGFYTFNAALVTFGLLCWAFPVRREWGWAAGMMWFWIVLELGNGLGHAALAFWRHGYFPGVATAPLLLLFGAWTAALLVRRHGPAFAG